MVFSVSGLLSDLGQTVANGFLMEMVLLLQRTQQQAKFDAGFVGCVSMSMSRTRIWKRMWGVRESQDPEGDSRAAQGLSAVWKFGVFFGDAPRA